MLFVVKAHPSCLPASFSPHSRCEGITNEHMLRCGEESDSWDTNKRGERQKWIKAQGRKSPLSPFDPAPQSFFPLRSSAVEMALCLLLGELCSPESGVAVLPILFVFVPVCAALLWLVPPLHRESSLLVFLLCSISFTFVRGGGGGESLLCWYSQPSRRCASFGLF